MELRNWIDGLVKTRYKTVRALAVSVGMTESGFSRAVKAGTFEVENCLKLAKESGESPAAVFEMAGKSDINALIESLYGKPRATTDGEAVKVAKLFSQLTDREAREGFVMMLRGYVRAQKAHEGEASETPSTPGSRRQ